MDPDRLAFLRANLKTAQVDYDAVKRKQNRTHGEQKQQARALRDQAKEELNNALLQLSNGVAIVQATPVTLVTVQAPTVPALLAPIPTAESTSLQVSTAQTTAAQAPTIQTSMVQATTAQAPAFQASMVQTPVTQALFQQGAIHQVPMSQGSAVQVAMQQALTPMAHPAISRQTAGVLAGVDSGGDDDDSSNVNDGTSDQLDSNSNANVNWMAHNFGQEDAIGHAHVQECQLEDSKILQNEARIQQIGILNPGAHAQLSTVLATPEDTARSDGGSTEGVYASQDRTSIPCFNEQPMDALSAASRLSPSGYESFRLGHSLTFHSRTTPSEHSEGSNRSDTNAACLSSTAMTLGSPSQDPTAATTADNHLVLYPSPPRMIPTAPAALTADRSTLRQPVGGDSLCMLAKHVIAIPDPHAQGSSEYDRYSQQSVTLNSLTAWNKYPPVQVDQGTFNYNINAGDLQSMSASGPEHPYGTNGSSNSSGHSGDRLTSDLQENQARSRASNAQMGLEEPQSLERSLDDSRSLQSPALPHMTSPRNHGECSPGTHPSNSQPSPHPQAVPYSLDIQSDEKETVCESPRLKAAQKRVVKLKQVISDLESALQAKVNEMDEHENRFHDKSQGLDLTTLFEQISPIQLSIKRFKSDIDFHSFDLKRADEYFIQLLHHEHDLALRSNLNTMLSDICSQLTSDPPLEYEAYLQITFTKKNAEEQLVEVEKRLRQSLPKFPDEVVSTKCKRSEDIDSDPEKCKETEEERKISRKRKGPQEGSSDKDSDDPDEKYEDEHAAQRKASSTRRVHRPKKEPNVDDDNDDEDDPHDFGKMSGNWLKSIAGKALAHEKAKKKPKKKNDSLIDADMEEGEVPDDDVPYGDSSPIPGLTTNEYEELERKGKAQLAEFLRTQDPEVINVSIRTLAGKHQALLPQSSYQSRQLALAMHYTAKNNFRCRYHAKFRSKKDFDGAGKYMVQGVGFKPDMQSDKRHPGHMSCGCPEEDVLLEFFFWKVWTTHSTNPSLKMHEEGMTGLVVTPRLRAFICAAFRKYTRITLDDIYNWSTSGQSFMVYTAMAQTHRLVTELQDNGLDIDVRVRKKSREEHSDGLEKD